MPAASAKRRKCKATNDAKYFTNIGRTSAEYSYVAEPNRAEHSAELSSLVQTVQDMGSWQ